MPNDRKYKLIKPKLKTKSKAKAGSNVKSKPKKLPASTRGAGTVAPVSTLLGTTGGAAMDGVMVHPHVTPRPRAPRLNKEVAVMAWIEDAYGDLLMVKQKAKRGKPGLWSFPGGKVAQGESLRSSLERELMEEIGVEVDVATPLDVFDRPDRSAFTMLFRVILKRGLAPRPMAEIDKAVFRKSLPINSTPSAQYFWQRAQFSFEPLHVFDLRPNVPQALGAEEE
ncbi:hypothetical protein DB346_00330 [Verrucomicrobia bacterium LW23]|nr:hypothetical protein DB346_00330 [Verrucomicrobia bacterium LW23]